MKIAYLGPRGTFSEEAATRFYRGRDVEFVMCDTIPDVIEAVGENRADQAIVPLENTIEGTINMTIDSLVSFEDLYIQGEYILPVSLHLLSNPGARVSDITEVWSISPIFTQCRKYIRQRQFKTVQHDSSAFAAEALKRSGRADAAAIGSRALAGLLGLELAQESIQDNPHNQTRFIIVGKGMQQAQEDRKKTMFLITPGQDQPGLLSAILNVFTALGINLSWIESRPTARKLGVYRFFLEANQYCSEEKTAKAVIILETLGHEVRVLGRFD